MFTLNMWHTKQRNSNFDATASFIWLSDIHLDPYYGQPNASKAKCTNSTLHPLGQFGCDASPLLFDAAIQRALDVQQGDNTFVKFVILTGDNCRHSTEWLDHPMNATQDILKTVSNSLASAVTSWNQQQALLAKDGNDGSDPFGWQLSIIPSIGNNDVTPDYFLNTDSWRKNNQTSSMLQMIAEGMAPLFLTQEEKSTFTKGGYFSRNINESLTILSLNTIIYSIQHEPHNSSDIDPMDQFQWLEIKLQQCQEEHRFVYLVGHIAPSIGSYRHSQLWHDSYLQRYYEIYNSFQSIVKGQFYGHLHSDEFRIPDSSFLRPSQDDESKTNTGEKEEEKSIGPVLWMASSITPVYGANPSIRRVYYKEETGEVLDYVTHYLDLDDANQQLLETTNETVTDVYEYEFEWKKGENFRDSFELTNLSWEKLHAMVQEMELNQKSFLWDVLLQRQHVYRNDDSEKSEKEDCDDTCKVKWICTFSSITKEQYEACVDRKLRDMDGDDGRNKLLPLQSIGFIGFVLGLTAVFIIVWKYRKQKKIQYQQAEQGFASSIEMMPQQQDVSIPEIT